jgi:hypothetical protein
MIKIYHPSMNNAPSEVAEESLPVWLDLGWKVFVPEPEKPVVKYVAKIGKDGKETLVEETPLKAKEESDQDVVEDPKEI